MATLTTPAPPHAPPGGSGDGSASGRLLTGDPGRASRTGIWVAFCAISMSFAALSSALIVRKGSTDWQHLELPWILYINTAVLLASSVTLELARRHVGRFMRTAGGGGRTRPLAFVGMTLGLGLLFVVGQVLAWSRMAAAGVYLASNPNSSFFYLLTAVHALHVLGGLAALSMVLFRLRGPVPTLRKSTLSAAAYYWHFMGLLWLYLLLLLRTQL